jgi:C1A family cysteine protease
MAKAKKTKKSTRTSKPVSKFILNCRPSKGMEQDWTPENAAEAGMLSAPAAIPASKDLRAAWWSINNQGNTGSCVGWATADSVMRWHFVKANRLTTNVKLSPRFVWMASKETDTFTTRPGTFLEQEGTSLKAALDIARKYGAVTDPILPFSGALYSGDPNTFYALAAQRKISSYFNLGRVLSVWRNWIATKGPILVRLDVDATWDHATQTGGNLTVYQPATTRGGHAVALVGYTPTTFIVRNSWGTTWGAGGFGFASDAYAAAAFTEAYGVQL